METILIMTSGDQLIAGEESERGVLTDAGWIDWELVAGWLVWSKSRYLFVPR
jgi:hypothetical protein